ncbi:MAG: ATP-binding cassette domain-containing protein, partial [Desulfarculus sp.]|nr:ATP-binding cassette domain-containing protein [Desulfarculus sp.]
MSHQELLRVDGLTCRFGGLVAVDGLSFVLGQGQLMGLIGPNGAGKTTVFNLLAGAVRPTSGRVFYRDQEITGQKAHRVNRLGLARTFQNIRLFGELSALDNVLVGFHGRLEANFLSAILRLPGYVAAERQMLTRAAEL